MSLSDQHLIPAVMHAAVPARSGRIIQADVCCDLVWAGGEVLLGGPQSLHRPSRLAGQAYQVLNLDPIVARHWLGLPLVELTNLQVPLADVRPDAAPRLAEIFQTGLAARLVSMQGVSLAYRVDARMAEAARVLRQTRSVGLAAHRVALSERQLERLFQDCFGLAPKRYATILRLRRAVRAAKQGLSLASAAADAGYVDQAHFNRDVRILAGAAPSAVIPHVGISQDRRVESRDY